MVQAFCRRLLISLLLLVVATTTSSLVGQSVSRNFNFLLTGAVQPRIGLKDFIFLIFSIKKMSSLLRFAAAGARHASIRRLSSTVACTAAKTTSTTALFASNNNNNKRWKSTAVDIEAHESESFLSGTSSLYAEQMYEQYLEDPASIHPSWKRYFDCIEQGLPYDESMFDKPTAAATSMKRTGSTVRIFINFYLLLYCV